MNRLAKILAARRRVAETKAGGAKWRNKLRKVERLKGDYLAAHPACSPETLEDLLIAQPSVEH